MTEHIGIPYIDTLPTDIYQAVHPDVGTAIVDAHRNQMVEVEYRTTNLTVSLPVISMESFHLGLFGRVEDEDSRRETSLADLRTHGKISPVLPIVYMVKSAAANRPIDVRTSDITKLYTQWIGDFTLIHAPKGYDKSGSPTVIEPVIYKAPRVAYAMSQFGVSGSDLLDYARSTFAIYPDQMMEDQILIPASVPLLTLVPIAAVDKKIASHIDAVNKHSWHLARQNYTYGFYRWIDDTVRREEKRKVRMRINWDDPLIPKNEQQSYQVAHHLYQKAIADYVHVIGQFSEREQQFHMGKDRKLVEQLLSCVMG